jgi:hypothetical protein
MTPPGVDQEKETSITVQAYAFVKTDNNGPSKHADTERSSKVDYELVLDARQTITVVAVPHIYGALREQPDETNEVMRWRALRFCE